MEPKYTITEKETPDDNASISMDLYGVKYHEDSLTDEERKKLEKCGEILRIRSQHRGIDDKDFFRTLGDVGLGDKVREGFKKSATTEKIKSLTGLAVSAGIFYVLGQNDFYPACERIANIGAICGAIGYTCDFLRTNLAEMRLDLYLRENL